MFEKPMGFLLLLCAGASLSACGTTENIAQKDPAFNTASQPVDPDDDALHTAIQEYLTKENKPRSSQYSFMRADLNNDGRREGIVVFNLPHTYWCGWGGCTMAVFQADDRSFHHLSNTSRIRGPIVIGRSQTRGWKDLGTRLSGMNIADHNVLLRFDGAGYPQDAAGQETLPYTLAQFGESELFP